MQAPFATTQPCIKCGQLCPGRYEAEHWKQVKGGASSPVLAPVSHKQVPSPVLGSLVQERQGKCYTESSDWAQNWIRDYSIWNTRSRWKTWGYPACKTTPQGRTSNRTVFPSVVSKDKTRNRYKLKHRKFSLKLRKKFSLYGWWTWNGMPRGTWVSILANVQNYLETALTNLF